MNATVKKKLSRPAKIAIWAGSSIVGLFAIIMIIGVIGISTSPGGWDGVRADQETKASAKASEKSAQAAADQKAKEEQAVKDAAKAKVAASAKASESAAAADAANVKATESKASASSSAAVAKASASADAAAKASQAAAAKAAGDAAATQKASASADAAAKASQAAAAKAAGDAAATQKARDAATAAKPRPTKETPKSPSVDNALYAKKVYSAWLASYGVKDSTEILMQDPSSVQGYLVSAESPTSGTVVFTAQLTKSEVTKDELKKAAMAVLQLVGFEDKSLDRVEIVTADSLVRGVANRYDSPLLNR